MEQIYCDIQQLSRFFKKFNYVLKVFMCVILCTRITLAEKKIHSNANTKRGITYLNQILIENTRLLEKLLQNILILIKLKLLCINV